MAKTAFPEAQSLCFLSTLPAAAVGSGCALHPTGQPPQLGSSTSGLGSARRQRAIAVAAVAVATSLSSGQQRVRRQRNRRRPQGSSLIARQAAPQQQERQATQQEGTTDTNPVALALRSQLAQLDKSRKSSGKAGRWEDWAYCRAILPEQQTPWGVVHFVGGAVLGQFPDLCYDELLRPLADRCGVAIICTPYETGPNHRALADLVAEKLDRALETGASRYGWPLQSMPRILLGHSLGTKLLVLNQCGAAADSPRPLGVGLMAFNNYGIRDQVRLLQEALKFVQGEAAMGGAGSILDQVLPALATAAEKAGMEFKPSPKELLEAVQLKYASSNVRTRLFCFMEDELDTSDDFLDAVEDGAGSMGAVDAPKVLPGGHLAPVFIGIEDILSAGSSSAQGTPASRVAERFASSMGGGGMGGMGPPNLGNKEEVEVVVESVEDWIRSLR